MPLPYILMGHHTINPIVDPEVNALTVDTHSFADIDRFTQVRATCARIGAARKGFSNAVAVIQEALCAQLIECVLIGRKALGLIAWWPIRM